MNFLTKKSKENEVKEIEEEKPINEEPKIEKNVIESVTPKDKIYNVVLYLGIRASKGTIGDMIKKMDIDPNVEVYKVGTFTMNNGQIIDESPQSYY